jgi:hypothetical protein
VTRLFDLLGVDFVQWKALTLAALKMDFRTTPMGAAHHRAAHRTFTLVSVNVFYLFMGGIASMIVIAINDVLLSGTIIVTYLMFMVGAMILMDHHSVITSPDDYMLLGFRPISSRTYFAARLTNVLVYTLALTTVFGILPMITLAFDRGHRIGLASVPAFYLATIFTTLAIVMGYAGLLRLVGASRLKQALSYLQLVMGFLSYGGYFAMSSVMDRGALAALTMPASPFLWLYPATWFASYLALAAGRHDLSLIVRTIVSLAALVGLASVVGGRLTLSYAERLGALTTATAAPRAANARRRRPVWFRTGEARAVALLVRAQFRHDQKFRMSILSVLPLTILYVFMSMRHGPLPDPFELGWRRAGDVMLITLAVLAFPTTLRMSLSRSDSYKASWIYFASPADRARLVRATKNVLIAFFLLPYLAFVAVFLDYFIRRPVHVVVHIGFLGLLSHLFLQIVILIDPALPFSEPMQKGTRSGAMLLTMFSAITSGFVVVPLLATFVYVSPLRIVLAAAALAAAGAGLDALTRVRIARMAERMEFEA